MKAILIAVLFLAASISLANAQPEALDAAAKEYEQANTVLDRTYKELIARTGDEVTKQAIKSAQDAWLKYRDLDAAATAGVTSQDGSAYSMDYYANLADLTKQRTVQLQKLLKLAK